MSILTADGKFLRLGNTATLLIIPAATPPAPSESDVSDGFETAYDPLHSSPKWEQARNIMASTVGLAYSHTAADETGAYFTGTFNANQYAAATHYGFTGGIYMGPTVRCSSNNYYGLYISGDNDWNLFKLINGVYVALQNGMGDFVAGDTLGIEASGTSIKAYCNGKQLGINQTDSSLTLGNPGICGYGDSASTTIYYFQGGNLASYCYQYHLVYNAMSTKPDASIATAQNTMVKTLVDASIWNKFDLFYCFANNASDNALINWKQPGTYNCAKVNEPSAFTAYEGYWGNGTNFCLNTNWVPSVNAVNYTLNDAAAGCYNRINWGDIDQCAFGNISGNNSLNFFLYDTGGTTLDYVNSGDYELTYFSADMRGLWIIARIDASTTGHFKNNDEVFYNINNSYGLPDVSILILARNADPVDNFSSHQLSFAFFGADVSTSDVSILYSAIQTYMTSLYSSQYQTVYNAFSTKPTIAVATAQNTMVKTLVDNGIWAKLDVLKIYANDASTNALINWKNPGTYNSTLSGSLVFTAYEGYTGDGTDYIIWNWNPNTNGVNYTQNSACTGCYLRLDRNATEVMYGISDATAGNQSMPRDSGNTSWSINDATDQMTACSDSRGMWVINRSASNARQLYHNNVNEESDAQASTGVPNRTMVSLVFDMNTTIWLQSQNQIAMDFAGGSLTAADVSILTTAFEVYMDSNGKGVI